MDNRRLQAAGSWHAAARLVAALMPFIVFALLYDSMRYYPNYLFGEIDIRGIYEAERNLFGIGAGAARLTPNEWWAQHTTVPADVAAGIFYLGWVPLPVAFGIWLCVSGRRREALRFSCAFLFINIVGFIGYYIHPAAPPWYVAKYGFEPIFDTGGDTAGLAGFDNIIGMPLFASIYAGNANVFAAVPSLHAAYCPVACFYALRFRQVKWAIALAVFSVGIWWTAVYTGHHYTIDVLLGIATAIVGVAAYELLLRHCHCIAHAMDVYAQKFVV